MNPVLKQLEETIAQMTATGAPFELDEVQVAGVSYRNYATMPANRLNDGNFADTSAHSISQCLHSFIKQRLQRRVH